ncbi:MAG: molybdenum cofactor biosynthesis protein MoaB [Planctomycetes bacterium]|nr:molybdenum cofactor biosynthesis protein MoaB [Planctomycetota bacterium]
MLQSDHKKHAAQQTLALNIAVIITSDTRTDKTDKTGNVLTGILQNAGHKCVLRKIVRNNLALIRSEVKKALKTADLVITSGGTGCGKKDLTIDAVSALITRKLEGFGEIFRLLSFGEIGSSAIMSRAMLGITRDSKLICALPGSPNAVSMALNKLLLPELAHICWELNR